MLQKLMAPLGTFQFQSQPQQIPLIRGVNIHELLFKVTAGVTITDPGGGAAGTVLAEGVQRLLKAIKLRHDGVDRMILDGRWAYRLYLRSGLDVVKATNIASGAAGGPTTITAYVSIPFERPWNARPFDTVWSGRTPVVQELAAYLEWETAKCNAVGGTSEGTAALLQSDNTMKVEFTTAPSVEVTQIYSTNAVQPFRVPHYFVRSTDPFAAARTDLEYSLIGIPPHDAVLMRDLYGTYSEPQAGVNYFTFQIAAGATKFYNRIPFADLQMQERRAFPAITVGADSRTGELLFLPTAGGKLSGVVEPLTLNDPKFVFDVATPTSGNGRIQMLFSELHRLPGVTRENL